MDPRDRADAALARARARGRHVITPDDAVSPMDASSTMQIPRAVVAAADTDEADTTMVIPAGQIRSHGEQYPVDPSTQPIPHAVPPYPEYSGYPAQYPVEEQDEPPPQHHYDGLVPTVQRPAPRRSAVSRRLEGH